MARLDRAIHAFLTLMRAAEVLRIFLLLGLTSFGGPVAHLMPANPSWPGLTGPSTPLLH
jgi:hypothetical protein